MMILENSFMGALGVKPGVVRDLTNATLPVSNDQETENVMPENTSETENTAISKNSQYQLFSLSYQELSELVGDEVDLLLKHIGNGHEDKALETYKDLLGHFGLLGGFENVNINDSSAETKMLRNELEDSIERKLNQGKAEEDFIELEDYIKSHCADATEQYWQETYYSDDKVDNYTEEDLLNTICGESVDKNVSGLNKTGSLLVNVLTLGFGTELWNDFWGNEPG